MTPEGWPAVDSTPDYMPPARGVGAPVGRPPYRDAVEEFITAVMRPGHLERIHYEATRDGDTETADAAMRLLVSVYPERAGKLAGR